MLWRESYRPQVRLQVELPGPSPSRVLIGAFDLRAQGELGVWWRLLESANLISGTTITLVTTSVPDATAMAAIVLPRSWQARLQIVDDLSGGWQDLVAPDRPERSFAAVTRGKIAEFLVVGPPTEEVWERFEDLATNP